MKMKSVQDLLLHEMQDVFDAEQQLTKALPKMAKGAHSTQLRNSLEEHLQVTKMQIGRLETAFQHLNHEAKGEHCDGMAGLIKEGNKALEEDMTAEMRDLAIMASAARVEHYEMSAYTTALTLAMACGEADVAALLRESLEEEMQAAQLLETNMAANSGAGSLEKMGVRAMGNGQSRR